MKILDNLATKIADKVNAKNDEVMSLTQENELLKQKLAASELTVSDYQKKIKKSDNELVRLNSKYTEVKKRLKDLAESGERQVDTIQDYAEQIIELQNCKPDKKLKQRNKELEKLLKDSESLIKNNTIYRKTYEFISDVKNKQSIKEVFQHNLKLWMENENLSNVKAAELLDVSDSMIAEWKNGRTALTVNSIQEVDLKLCEYFECSVYELVTVKMEVSQ